MGKVERQFKGIWIPADIWLDPDLTPTEKILLADIDSFTGNGKTFYKSNDTLSLELHTSVSTIKRAIKTLSQRKYINISGTTRSRLISTLNDKVHIDPNKSDKVHSGRDKVQIDLDKVQNDPPLGSNCTPTNTVTNTTTNSILTKGIMLPFEDSIFKLAWVMWIDERKARRYQKYTPIGEQAALHKLHKESNEDLQTALEMINESIANSWKGIFPLKTKKNGKPANKGFDSEEYLAHLKTLK